MRYLILFLALTPISGYAQFVWPLTYVDSTSYEEVAPDCWQRVDTLGYYLVQDVTRSAKMDSAEYVHDIAEQMAQRYSDQLVYLQADYQAENKDTIFEVIRALYEAHTDTTWTEEQSLNSWLIRDSVLMWVFGRHTPAAVHGGFFDAMDPDNYADSTALIFDGDLPYGLFTTTDEVKVDFPFTRHYMEVTIDADDNTYDETARYVYSHGGDYYDAATNNRKWPFEIWYKEGDYTRYIFLYYPE